MTDPQNPAEPTPPAYSAAPPAQPYAAAPPAAYGPPASATIPGHTLGIVAFVLSFFTGLIALVLGIVALVQSKRAGFGNGWALAAIIISSVSVVLVIFLIAIIPLLGAVIQNSQ
jgi:hypothetical protein